MLVRAKRKEKRRKKKAAKNTPKNGDGVEMFLDGDYLPRPTRLRPSTSGLCYSLAKMNGGGGGEATVQDLSDGGWGMGGREGEKIGGWLVVSEQDGAIHVQSASPVQSGSAAFLRRFSSARRRLGVVLLARSVDVVEERHGEGHAQELRRKRRGKR